jgi:hypothetical protein
MWGCKPHWFALPAALRAKVWRAYRPGQEEDLDVSDEYFAVAHEVQAWIATNAAPGEEGRLNARLVDALRDLLEHSFGHSSMGCQGDCAACLARRKARDAIAEAERP